MTLGQNAERQAYFIGKQKTNHGRGAMANESRGFG